MFFARVERAFLPAALDFDSDFDFVFAFWVSQQFTAAIPTYLRRL
jgi:hypothetical protein